MPPRALCSSCARSISKLLPPAVLPAARQSPLPSITSQHRHASILSSLSDLPSSYKKRIRLGRGPASGKGKTSGRGHKGQKQHGKVPRGFEGGQTPIEIVHGKRGFKNVFSPALTTLPLSRIQSWLAQRRLSAAHPITVRELVRSNCISMPRDGVKLLATSFSHQHSLDAQPPLTQPLHIVVSRASASAIAAVEKAGGKVTTRYYTRWAIRKIVEGSMDPMVSMRSEGGGRRGALELGAEQEVEEGGGAGVVPGETSQYRFRLPDAVSRKAIEYYRDPAHRGYLAHTVEEGRGPSLFFRPPVEMSAAKKAAQARKRKKLEENRMW